MTIFIFTITGVMAILPPPKVVRCPMTPCHPIWQVTLRSCEMVSHEHLYQHYLLTFTLFLSSLPIAVRGGPPLSPPPRYATGLTKTKIMGLGQWLKAYRPYVAASASALICDLSQR